jgi:hypothetical protein
MNKRNSIKRNHWAEKKNVWKYKKWTTIMTKWDEFRHYNILFDFAFNNMFS